MQPAEQLWLPFKRWTEVCTLKVTEANACTKVKKKKKNLGAQWFFRAPMEIVNMDNQKNILNILQVGARSRKH